MQGTGSLGAQAAHALEEAVNERLAWVRMEVVPSPTGRRTSEVLAAAARGGDPLAPWREETLAGWEEMYAVPREDIGPHVAAAFVLQWYAEVLALPMTAAAAGGPWVLDPGALAWEADPRGHHPVRLELVAADDSVRAEADEARRWEAARAAYDVHVAAVAATFAPQVRMSSRQREGIPRDVWESARRRAIGADPTVQRESCCFIFRLPGCHECAGCPRLAGSPSL